jgi:hypothetical protein
MRPGAADRHDQPDYAKLGANLESAKGPYYLKMVGPQKTVEGAAADFDAFLGSLAAK